MTDAGEEKVKEAFGARTYEKGRNYFREGRVVELVVDGDKIAGKVVGSRDAPYRVTLNWEDGISSACSCPVGEMCKHGAALAPAFLSDDADRVDLEKVREEVRRLDGEEAKGLLAECMVREPKLTRLLRAGDGPRVEKALGRLGRSLSGSCGPLVPCDELDLEIEGARRWGGKEADRDRAELALRALEMLIHHLEEGWDEHDDDDRVHEASGSLTDLLRGSLKPLSEKDLLRLLERLIALEEQDDYEVGAAAMMDIVAEEIGPEGLLKLLKGDRAGGRRAATVRELAVQVLDRSGDPAGAAELLAGDGASPEEVLEAAEMLIEGGEPQRAKELLSGRGLDRGDLRRASLLLKASGGAPLKAGDVDVKGLLSSLDRSVPEYSGDEDADEVLSVLRSFLGEQELLGRVRERPDGPGKLLLLAKLGRDREAEALYLRDEERYQSVAWTLALAFRDPRAAGRMALRAAPRSTYYLEPREEAALRAAIMECGAGELKQLNGFTTRDQDLTVRTFGYLAERDPGLAGDLLKERFGQVDPEHVMRAVDRLRRDDRRTAVDPGMAWVRRKLDGSPRYDRILAMLLKVKEAAGPEDRKVRKEALREGYADRKKLSEVLDRIG